MRWLQVQYEGWVDGEVPLGARAGVQHRDTVDVVTAISLVDMPENTGFQRQLMDPFQQIGATDMLLLLLWSLNDFIPDTGGRSMGDQDIGIVRNQLPALP